MLFLILANIPPLRSWAGKPQRNIVPLRAVVCAASLSLVLAPIEPRCASMCSVGSWFASPTEHSYDLEPMQSKHLPRRSRCNVQCQVSANTHTTMTSDMNDKAHKTMFETQRQSRSNQLLGGSTLRLFWIDVECIPHSDLASCTATTSDAKQARWRAFDLHTATRRCSLYTQCTSLHESG